MEDVIMKVKGEDYRRSVFWRVAREIEDSILLGVFRDYDYMATTKDLCKEYGVSDKTVSRAIWFLKERGLLVKELGVGIKVVDNAIEKVREIRKMEAEGLVDELMYECNVIFGKDMYVELYRMIGKYIDKVHEAAAQEKIEKDGMIKMGV